MAEIRNYTAEDMKTEKLAENHLTLVDFWATWCGPCRMIAPIVEELAGETQDVAFGKVNVDEESEAAVALGIQAIPTDLYEAAEIDGAGAFSKFFHVTLPGIKPVLIYVITITVLGGFAMFTESVALWQQNNPGGVGRTIVGYMYLMGFYKNNMGLASAVGLTLLVLVLGVNLIQLILMGFFKKEA